MGSDPEGTVPISGSCDLGYLPLRRLAPATFGLAQRGPCGGEGGERRADWRRLGWHGGRDGALPPREGARRGVPSARDASRTTGRFLVTSRMSFAGICGAATSLEGIVHLRCPRCQHDLLVAFSCKNRGLCPSCAGRRMGSAGGAPRRERRDTMHLLDRQRVLSLLGDREATRRPALHSGRRGVAIARAKVSRAPSRMPTTKEKCLPGRRRRLAS
jgi:hypothetical protein